MDPFSRPLFRSLGNPELVLSEQDSASRKTHTWEIQHTGRQALKSKQTNLDRVVSEPRSSKCSISHPNIDLFATHLNHRVPLYVSPIPDQKALSIDALSMNWNRIHAYAFPPFRLIPALINKIRVSQCKIVLIAHFWPSRSWFPELLGLLVSPPITLPVIPNLLEQLQGRFRHQNIDMLQLHVWELSSNQSEIKKNSEQVADYVSKARRKSTGKVYDAKWKIFVNWANQRKVDPIQASPHVIADFLTFLFTEKKCQVSTIKGYRSTISNTVKFKAGYDIG